jgi:hypothetical protein
MRSFCTRRAQKHIKDNQVVRFFTLLGSACVKAACKHVDEIDSWLIIFGSKPSHIKGAIQKIHDTLGQEGATVFSS